MGAVPLSEGGIFIRNNKGLFWGESLFQEGGNYFTDYFYGSYNALADHVSANGYSISQSYARGLDPDNASETNLLALIKMKENRIRIKNIPLILV